jgi:hypothetical protein
MAEDNVQETAKVQPKTAAKRKTTAKRKVSAKRSTTTATAQRRTTARGKTATQRKTTGRRSVKRAPSLQDRVSEAGRSAFLASLGFYGMAYDQLQDQLKNVESELQARRKKADKLYAQMVKRGEKVEKQAREALEDIELPKLQLDELTDRSKLEARLEKARERFAEMRDSIGLKAAA